MPNDAQLSDSRCLSLRGIAKQFSGCLANDRVDPTVARNEIHPLLGENGAGKSTLVKTNYGVSARSAGGPGNDWIDDSLTMSVSPFDICAIWESACGSLR